MGETQHKEHQGLARTGRQQLLLQGLRTSNSSKDRKAWRALAPPNKPSQPTPASTQAASASAPFAGRVAHQQTPPLAAAQTGRCAGAWPREARQAAAARHAAAAAPHLRAGKGNSRKQGK